MVGWMDIVFILVLLVAAAFGVLKGFVKEAVAIASTVGGFVLAAAYYPFGADLLGGLVKNASAARFLSFMFILVLVVVLGMLLVKLMSRWIKGPLKFLDRLFGLAFGFVQGVLICGALVFSQVVFPVDKKAIENSRLAPYCFGLTKAMVHLIPQELKDQFKSAFQEILSKSEKIHG
ncbi:MAG: CvpA family protein [Candidatus Aminicenantes bacterium]|nr:CvpA family protein [Candidatus Aminicenantes bacterium]